MVSMNRLSREDRTRVIACLVEGNSIRSTVRMTGIAKNTVTKLLVEIGAACSKYQDEAFRNLNCKRLQADEIWSFVYAKAKNVKPEHFQDGGYAGDVWTWTAIDADTKLVPCWMVGGRDAAAALALHFCYYNFVRVHQTLKTTPAIAAGVTTKRWQIADIVALLEGSESN